MPLIRCSRSDLSVRSKQLFKYFNVRHAPMRCKCAQPVLRRQDTKYSQPDGYSLVVEVPKAMDLADGVSRAMWERLARRSLCPECEAFTEPVHDFDKFAYLPEVLFIQLYYIYRAGGPTGGPETYQFPSGPKLNYPEYLDMSAFRDDPTRPGDQTDCIYKLQSIVHNKRNESAAALRMSEDEWRRFEYTSGYKDVGFPGDPNFVTFENITDSEPGGGRPQMLMYVRDHHAEATGVQADAVEPKSNKPQGDTTKAVTPTPSQPKPQDEQSIVASLAGDYGTDDPKLRGFIDAQDFRAFDRHGIETTFYEEAIISLEQGKFVRADPCIDFMFPVIAGVNKNPYGKTFDFESPRQEYAINSLDEARAYWETPLLKDRYIEMMQIIRNHPDITDLDLLFAGGKADAQHFLASMTLFMTLFETIYGNEGYNNELFNDVLERFDELHHIPSIHKVQNWFRDEGNNEAVNAIEEWVPARPPPTDDSTASTSTNDDFARRIGSKLLSLADQDLSGDDPDSEAEALSGYNRLARDIGKFILGFGLPENMAAPASTPETEEKARRLGRHILSLGHNNHSPEKANKTSAPPEVIASFGLDGTSDEPDGGADLDDDLHEAVAIPTDPNDPRIKACENWTLDELKREFQKEQLDWRGLRADPQKHRMKFRKHFELERDYSIYHEARLRQAIEERGIRLRRIGNKGDKIDKAELVDALTNYDAQRLEGAEYLDGDDDSEDTESAEYEPEPYESSEASGNEAYYVERERAALSAKGKGGATSAQPRAVAVAARARKRPRSEDEEDDYDDEDEEDEELMPRVPAKGPVRMRTRY